MCQRFVKQERFSRPKVSSTVSLSGGFSQWLFSQLTALSSSQLYQTETHTQAHHSQYSLEAHCVYVCPFLSLNSAPSTETNCITLNFTASYTRTRNLPSVARQTLIEHS